MSKHTDGPWEAFKDRGRWFVRCPAGETVCTINQWTNAIDAADACLIAAAPTLLATLKLIALDPTRRDTMDWEMIADLIAVAEGRAPALMDDKREGK